MTEKDYYEILGIGRNTDAADIKKAYRKLVMQFHPDRNRDDPEATERMKELNEAYAVLSNPEKRRIYDRYGHEGLRGYSQEDIFRGTDFSRLFREFGIGDLFGFGGSIFGDLFGGGAARRGAKKGVDVRYNLSLTLEEAAFGSEKIIHVPSVVECSACKGTGAEPGGMEVCDQCKGTGQIVTERRTGSSVFRQISFCHKCQGRGKIVTQPCKQCDGKGVIEKTGDIKVKIPAGVDTGYAIKVEGEGEKGKDLPGDLYVFLEIERHSVFERHGDDLYRQQEISFTLATLGGEIQVPDLAGDTFALDIPEGTQTGSVFRIEGRGLPHLGAKGKGDEYVIVKVVTPTGLSKRQKELLEEFQAISKGGDDPRAKSQNWL